MRPRSLIAVTALVAALTLPAAADPIIPSYGLDSASLGRGGTVIAAHGGASSAFGNPATLRPYGAFSIGADMVRTRSSEEGSWTVRVIDSQSPVRGTLAFMSDPAFAGTARDLWALGLAESIGSGLILGQGLRTLRYDAGDGDERLTTADLGAVVSLGQRLSVGFVTRNLYRSADDLAPRTRGAGILLRLPWTIDLSVDYERAEEGRAYPSLLRGTDAVWGESEFRGGVEFSPIAPLTARLGYVAPSDGSALYTAGLTYSDQNGSLDAAIAYDPEDEKTQVVTFGVSIGR